MVAIIISFLILFIIAVIVSTVRMKVDSRKRDQLLKIKEMMLLQSEVHPFSVSDYYQRMERQQLELQEEKKNKEPYVIILWWGIDSLRLNDDGGFEWISKREKQEKKEISESEFAEKVRATKEKIWSLQAQEPDDKIQSIRKNIEILEKLKSILENRRNNTRDCIESYITSRALLNVHVSLKRENDKLRDEIAKQQLQTAQIHRIRDVIAENAIQAQQKQIDSLQAQLLIQQTQAAHIQQNKMIINSMQCAPPPYPVQCGINPYTPQYWTGPPHVLNSLQHQDRG